MQRRMVRVKLSGTPVGTLEEVGDETRFTYLPGWLSSHDARPVSFTLPLREQPYVSKGLHPFFENLLPEGWLLEVASKSLRISKSDAFGILAATCSDCIGDVEIEPMEN